MSTLLSDIPVPAGTTFSDWLQVAEVLGIWAAVVAALFLQWLSEKRHNPTLSLAYTVGAEGDNRYLHLGNDNTHPDTTFLGDSDAEGTREELWIRLRVKNEGRVQARNVEIRLVGIRRLQDGKHENRPGWWLKASHFNAASVSLPPKFTHHFDFAFIINDSDSDRDVEYRLCTVKPDLLAWPAEKERIEKSPDSLLENGYKYAIYLGLGADNSDAKYFKVTIEVSPRKREDPPCRSLLRRDGLLSRLSISPPERIAPEDAFGT